MIDNERSLRVALIGGWFHGLIILGGMQKFVPSLTLDAHPGGFALVFFTCAFGTMVSTVAGILIIRQRHKRGEQGPVTP